MLGPINKPRWIYSCSKQLLDRVIAAYGQQEGLRYTLFRPFNWIGPKLDDIDAAKEGSSRVVTQFIINLFRGEPIRLVDGGEDRADRDGDDRQVHLAGDGADGGPGWHARNVVRALVDRVDAAVEGALDEVAEDRVADPARGAPRADHGDALGLENPAQRGHRREPLTLTARRPHAANVGDVEADPDDACLGRPHPLDEPRVAEHLEHGQVLGHGLGAKAGDPHRAADLRQVLEEQRGDASTLELVADHEGDLGLPGRRDAEVGHSDHGSGVERSEVGVGGGVARREAGQLLVGQLVAG